MEKHVLLVTVAITEPTQDIEELGMESGDTSIIGGRFTGFFDLLVNFFLPLFDSFFDAGRVNPSVTNELLESLPGNLASHWIKAGDNN